PDELDALFLGVLHLAQRARHVRLVAAIEAVDAGGALADRRAHAVHRGVAAADHDDALALRVQAAVLVAGHGIAQTVAVRRRQIGHRRHDVAEPRARRLDVARLVDAGGDQHGIVLLAQILQGGVAADLEIEMELHAGLDQQLRAAFDDMLFQLEVRDAVDHQPAGAVVAVVDMHLVAEAAQAVGSRQTRRPGADDADALRPLAVHRMRRLHPAVPVGGFGDVFLDGADGDGAVARLRDDAGAFAEAGLRGEGAGDARRGVGRLA